MALQFALTGRNSSEIFSQKSQKEHENVQKESYCANCGSLVVEYRLQQFMDFTPTPREKAGAARRRNRSLAPKLANRSRAAVPRTKGGVWQAVFFLLPEVEFLLLEIGQH